VHDVYPTKRCLIAVATISYNIKQKSSFDLGTLILEMGSIRDINHVNGVIQSGFSFLRAPVMSFLGKRVHRVRDHPAELDL
jgi:hypothetical protein